VTHRQVLEIVGGAEHPEALPSPPCRLRLRRNRRRLPAMNTSDALFVYLHQRIIPLFIP
jgi:hypothetical protein